MSSISSIRYNRHQYALILTNNYSHVFMLHTMRHKNKVMKQILKVYTKIKAQMSKEIQHFHTDLEGEFQSNNLVQ